MSDQQRKDAIRCQLDLMEKEIVYFKGKKRIAAKRKYYKFLQSCDNTCELGDPIYLSRYE
ncbi:MAG: hypothetical protein ACTSQA_05315 [Candidatus Heimdallarchaeaceae archaeon]